MTVYAELCSRRAEEVKIKDWIASQVRTTLKNKLVQYLSCDHNYAEVSASDFHHSSDEVTATVNVRVKLLDPMTEEVASAISIDGITCSASSVSDVVRVKYPQYNLTMAHDLSELFQEAVADNTQNLLALR